jgi:hypothetical protein
MHPSSADQSGYFVSLQKKHRRWLNLLLLTAFSVAGMVWLFQVDLQLPFSLDRALQAFAAILSLAGLYAGYRRYQLALQNLRLPSMSIGDRPPVYRKAVLEWWKMIAFPGIGCFTVFALTHNFALFLLGLFHLGMYFISAPRREIIGLLLQMSEAERKEWGL